ncbi:MAG: AAA family ATPase [Nitrospirota bacterium]
MASTRFPVLADNKDFMNGIASGIWEDPACHYQAIIALLQNDVQKDLKSMESSCSAASDDLAIRLKRLKTTFNLSRIELEIVAFLFLMEYSAIINAHFCSRDEAISNFTDAIVFQSRTDCVLGIDRADFVQAVFSKKLTNAYILEKNWRNRPQFELSVWCMNYLCGTGNGDIGSELFERENDEQLTPDEFNVTPDERAIIERFMTSEMPGNILFYGEPGTGKTSFARSLAKKHGKELLSVKAPDADTKKEHIAAIQATLNMADRLRSIVLVDEADDILNSASHIRPERSATKSWINTLLDKHGKQAIWITNRTKSIELSTMRRFTFAVEFRQFDSKKRSNVLKHELARKGIPIDYFDPKDIEGLCKDFGVNAAGIVNAISLVGTKGADQSQMLKDIRTILQNHEKVISKNGLSNEHHVSESYSLDGLNTSDDLKVIITGAIKYREALSSAGREGKPFSMLLYGMPGTGKSEFVNYLGDVLDLRVLLRRASDIRDSYVGETEKNIARAFREARETSSILFFDEADTFLYPRAAAQRSWEISFTNEILTQLESFRGIVAFATNDIDGLDHAALRRFRFKIRFDPLTPDGNEQFYQKILLPLSGDTMIPSEVAMQVRNLRNLTPGDFSVVKDRYAFEEGGAIFHDKLIDALREEVAHKKNITKIGYC